MGRLILPVALLVAISTLLWLSYGFASGQELFGSSALSTTFRIAATTSTGILFVVIATHAVIRLGFGWLLQYQPTQLQRGLVVVLLSFVATATALAYFGFDLGPLLTASALLSAIVGLSVQPLLASLMSGLSLHRMVRVGDGVLLDGEQVRITSLNWRSVMATRPDGSAVIVPNARLADGTLQVLAHDRSTRGEVVLDLPATIAPHRVRRLVTDLIDDFDEVDSTRPIVVLPQKSSGGNALASYRAEFWVSQYAQRADLEGRILRRSWYAFRREGMTPSAEAAGDPQAGVAHEIVVSAVCAALRSYRGDAQSRAPCVIAGGEMLMYDDGERIVLPERLAGCFCVVIDGQLTEVAAGTRLPGDPWGTGQAAPAGHELTRAASMALIERALAARIGPYAGPLLARTSADRASLEAVCEAVAQEIDDAEERQVFLREVRRAPVQKRGPGFLFRCQRDTAQRLVPNPQLIASDYALVLAAPESSLTTSGTLAGAPAKALSPQDAAVRA